MAQVSRLRWTATLWLCVAAGLNAHAPSIELSRQALSFAALPGGPNPPSQSVMLRNSTHGRMPWNVTASTMGGGNWLTVTPTSGFLPGVDPGLEWTFLTVFVNSSRLAAGVYTGSITVAAAGDALSPPADNTPQRIDVTLTVSAQVAPQPAITLTPAVLNLEATSGGSATATFQVSNSGAGTLSWTAAAQTSGGGAWLSVTPASGVNTVSVTVRATAASLPPGTYSGQISVAASGTNTSPRSVAVTLIVRAGVGPALRVNPAGLNFSLSSAATSVPAQRIEISDPAEGRFNWRASVTTFNGGPWLTVEPAEGSTPGALTVAVAPEGLTADIYLGRITLTASEATNSPVQVPVTLTVLRPRPVVDSRAVVNGATFLPSLLAPGQIVTIFGSGLGPTEPTLFQLDPLTRKIPVRLAGTQVTFDGVPAPLFFASAGQVNLQVPFEVAGRVSTRMIVYVEGMDPVELSLPVAPAAPGVFTLDGTRAAALNQDSTLNSPQNAAAPGSVLQMFLTGQGALDPPIETGALAPTASPFPAPVLPVKVTMSGVEASVLFAGAAPGLAGLLQLNVEVPRGLAGGEVSVSVLVGTFPLGRRATIAVQ